MGMHSKTLLGVSVALLIAGGLAGCDDSEAIRNKGPQFHEEYQKTEKQPSIWVDNDTGCQYVQAGHGYVLRYTIDGRPWCGVPTPQQRGRPAGAQP